jgi:hypothetical protein
LGAAPAFIITKGIDSVASWYTYHKDLDATNPNDYYLTLNTTDAASSLADSFGPNVPDSTTFGDRLLGFSAGEDVIAYCFAPVAGYSAFGSYTGNGSSDGPVIVTGFRPALVILKRTDGAAAWYMYDYKRDGYNAANKLLYANYSNAEADNHIPDFLSNGFKIRTTGTVANGNGNDYIYMAWAKNPFSSNGGLAR